MRTVPDLCRRSVCCRLGCCEPRALIQACEYQCNCTLLHYQVCGARVFLQPWLTCAAAHTAASCHVLAHMHRPRALPAHPFALYAPTSSASVRPSRETLAVIASLLRGQCVGVGTSMALPLPDGLALCAVEAVAPNSSSCSTGGDSGDSSSGTVLLHVADTTHVVVDAQPLPERSPEPAAGVASAQDDWSWHADFEGLRNLATLRLTAVAYEGPTVASSQLLAPHGAVITGGTGSGKSSFLRAVVAAVRRSCMAGRDALPLRTFMVRGEHVALGSASESARLRAAAAALRRVLHGVSPSGQPAMQAGALQASPTVEQEAESADRGVLVAIDDLPALLQASARGGSDVRPGRLASDMLALLGSASARGRPVFVLATAWCALRGRALVLRLTNAPLGRPARCRSSTAARARCRCRWSWRRLRSAPESACCVLCCVDQGWALMWSRRPPLRAATHPAICSACVSAPRYCTLLRQAAQSRRRRRRSCSA